MRYLGIRFITRLGTTTSTLHLFNGLLSRTTEVSRYQKGKPIWILLKQETVSGSGISWAVCKSAPCSRQITTPTPHHSVFYRPDALPATKPTASKHWRHLPVPCCSYPKFRTLSVCAVLVYKCSAMASGCGRCRSVEAAFNCGWCPSTRTCTVQSQCVTDTESLGWLDSQHACPNPAVNFVSLSSCRIISACFEW